MTGKMKTFAQLTRESASFEKAMVTTEFPDASAAEDYGLCANVLYLRVYTAEKPDDALAEKAPRVYTAGNRTELRETFQLVHFLEARRNDEAFAETLPHLFSRLTRDAGLQQKFNAAVRKPGAADKVDAVVALLKTELPDDLFLTPQNGGFIRMEKGDVCIDANFKYRFPRSARVM